MFEAAELGQKISKQKFSEYEPALRTGLLDAQRALRSAEIPTVIVISGVEGAGKGNVVDQLNKWLDTRGLRTFAFWDRTDEESQRPRFWQFWQALPSRGEVSVMFGSWYTQPIVERAFGRCDQAGYERELRRIEEFERLLVADGTLFVKFWFHLSKDTQQERLKEDVKRGRFSSPLLRKYAKRYDTFARVSERALRLTDTALAPWHLIEATDKRYRDIRVGEVLLSAMRSRLESKRPIVPSFGHEPIGSVEQSKLNGTTTILDHVDLAQTITDSAYDRQLKKLQREIRDLAWKGYARKHYTVLVFEGWDAAGKGGAIRRITQAVDARLYRTISIAAPTDEEKAHHYLWRFWRHIPRAGYMTVYDRSWYGRVLVERVEGFAEPYAWQRAYQEINDFEEQLVEHGVTLLKFWLHIDAEEQLRRFKEREQIEWKKHKITEEDWRNREKWDDYASAVNDMVARTSTAHAPWSLVAANDKRLARITVAKTLRDRLKAALD